MVVGYVDPKNVRSRSCTATRSRSLGPWQELAFTNERVSYSSSPRTAHGWIVVHLYHLAILWLIGSQGLGTCPFGPVQLCDDEKMTSSIITVVDKRRNNDNKGSNNKVKRVFVWRWILFGCLVMSCGAKQYYKYTLRLFDVRVRYCVFDSPEQTDQTDRRRARGHVQDIYMSILFKLWLSPWVPRLPQRL
jgi:hypothetical protein